jgi:glutamate dehydrogenase/leucine dehydrogenase
MGMSEREVIKTQCFYKLEYKSRVKLMRFAIIGVGAVGGYFGARLAQAGEDVVFIDLYMTVCGP